MNRPDDEALSRVLDAVLRAFPETLPPSIVSTGGRWFDEGGVVHACQDPEASEVDRFFGARGWAAITPAELLAWDHASVNQIFLAPVAHAHYLPAYLRAILAPPPDADWMTLLDAAIPRWTPPGALPGNTRQDVRTHVQREAMTELREAAFRQFTEALTEPQKAALASFLEVFEPSWEEPDLDNTITTKRILATVLRKVIREAARCRPCTQPLGALVNGARGRRASAQLE